MGKQIHNAVSALAQNLRAVLAQQKRSARDVAAAARLSNATVSNLLRGKHQASIATAQEVADALGYDLWQLLCPYLPQDRGEFKRLAALVDHYLAADREGRELINRTAELAARHAQPAGE